MRSIVYFVRMKVSTKLLVLQLDDAPKECTSQVKATNKSDRAAFLLFQNTLFFFFLFGSHPLVTLSIFSSSASETATSNTTTHHISLPKKWNDEASSRLHQFFFLFNTYRLFFHRRQRRRTSRTCGEKKKLHFKEGAKTEKQTHLSHLFLSPTTWFMETGSLNRRSHSSPLVKIFSGPFST